MKKYNKLFIFTIMTFFITVKSIFAREMTLDELSTILNEKNITQAYIIGEYVYTSDYITKNTLSTKDVMLSSRSIDVPITDGYTNVDPIYNKMSINKITRNINNIPSKTDKWTNSETVLGTEKLKEKFNIKYIDYELQSELTTASITTEIDSKFDTKLSELKFENGNNNNSNLEYDESTEKLTGVLKKYTKIDDTIFSSEERHDYYFAFVVNVLNASDDTTVTIIGDKEKKISYDKFDFKSSENSELLVLFAVNPDSENKVIKVIVDKDGDKLNYQAVTYKIDLSDIKYEKESVINVTSEENTNSKTDFNNWKYDRTLNQDVTINKGAVTGTLAEQILTENAFGKGNERGYYFDFTFLKPSEVSKDNIYIARLEDDKERVKKEFQKSDFDNDGNLTILFRLPSDINCLETTCKAYYKIDWDGEGEEYTPTIYELDYSSLQFKKLHKVSFKGIEEAIDVLDQTKLTSDLIPESTPTNDKYHDFKYWSKTDGTKYDELTITEDTELVPFYDIYVDEFIKDKIEELNSENSYNDKINFELNENNIKINITDVTTTLDILNTTKIPNIISDVLKQEEIKNITFQIDEENKVVFDKNSNLENVKEEIKKLYEKVLSKTDNLTTLSSLAVNNSSFKIIIGENIDIVNLINKNESELNKEFIFTYETDTVLVNNEKELKTAINNEKINTILINDSFELIDENTDELRTHTLVIDGNRNILIKSYETVKTISDNERTQKDAKTPVILVKSGTVTFEDLKIEGATRAISVLSGAKVIVKNVVAVDSLDAGFDVEEGAIFEGTNIKYQTSEGIDKESYHFPTICGKGSVTITDNENVKVVKNYERIAHRTGLKYTDADLRDPETNKYYPDFQKDGNPDVLNEKGQNLLNSNSTRPWDELIKTGHTHYYFNEENTHYYWTYLRDGAITKRYFVYGEEIEMIPINYKTTGYYKNVIEVEGVTYVQDGYSLQDYYSLNERGGRDYYFNTTKVTDVKKIDGRTIFPRYVKGYSVTIKVGETTYKFGVVENSEKTLNNLMNEIKDFKDAYDALNSEASASEKTLVDKNNGNTPLDLNANITKNIEIVISE